LEGAAAELCAVFLGVGEVISVRPGDDIAAIYDIQPRQPGEPHLQAAFVVLAMNRDAPDVVLSMQRLLRRFNNTDTRSGSCSRSCGKLYTTPSARSVHWLVKAQPSLAILTGSSDVTMQVSMGVPQCRRLQRGVQGRDYSGGSGGPHAIWQNLA
jgi:hypothetical protein